jgi:hypothetical protein
MEMVLQFPYLPNVANSKAQSPSYHAESNISIFQRETEIV